METSYIVIFVLIIVLFIQHRNEKVWIRNHILKKKRKETTEMLELAKRFIEKECIIYTFNNQLVGTIKEIEGNALMIEKNGVLEAVNLDFVVRIREYPKKKNGKKKSVVLD